MHRGSALRAVALAAITGLGTCVISLASLAILAPTDHPLPTGRSEETVPSRQPSVRLVSEESGSPHDPAAAANGGHRLASIAPLAASENSIPARPSRPTAGWQEVGTGSATGGGISDNAGYSSKPAVAVAPGGKLYVAWQDDSSGDHEIYVRRWTGSQWEAVGAGSAEGGGISDNDGQSYDPSLAIAPDGTAFVAWEDDSSGEWQIYVRRWDGSAWKEVGDQSASGVGLSANETSSSNPSLAIGPYGKLYVAWDDGELGSDWQIYVRRWNGNAWEEVGDHSASGEGISANDHGSTYPSMAVAPDGTPYVAWADDESSDTESEIYVRRWVQGEWEEVGTESATGGGISDDRDSSGAPSVAVAPDGTPYVGWTHDPGAGHDQIYMRRWDGNSWVEAGSGSDEDGGISDNDTSSACPATAVAPDGTLYTAWHNYADGGALEIYVRHLPGEGPTYTIAGHVRNRSGTGLSDVLVSAAEGGNATTDDTGAYAIADLMEGTYTLVPIKAGLIFTPGRRIVHVPPDGVEQDFTHAVHSLVGRVYVGLGDHPVPQAQVTVREAGKAILTTTTDATGFYSFGDVITAPAVTVRVTLQAGAASPATFRVRHGLNDDYDAPPVVYVETTPFAAVPGVYTVNNVDFGETRYLTTDAGIPKERLDDLAAIYYHTWQSAQLADRRAITLDHNLPVDVYAFATRDGADVSDSCYWSTVAAHGPYIMLGEDESGWANGDRPGNREWHEFGHHIMADAFGNHMPTRPGADRNHGGYYSNTSTSDSWAEGWAEFWSMLVASEISGTARPEIYPVGAARLNLEDNWEAWTAWGRSTPEELAVASMLWDLYDPTKVADRDSISLTSAQLLDVLVSDTYTDFNPAAEPNQGYPYDVLTVYSATVSHTVRLGTTVTEVNQIFVSHGLFYDANCNQRWDAGERVGQVAYNGCIAHTNRITRRNQPLVDGSYVAYTAVEAGTRNPLTVTKFVVSVAYDPPYEDHSYTYATHTRDDVPGLLYSVAPPPGYPATVSVTPLLLPYRPESPLTYTTSFYWDKMSESVGDAFIEHVFVMEPTSEPLYLPLVLHDYARDVPPSGGNLISNGDFEAGQPPDPWVPYTSETEFLVVDGAGYDGSWGAALGGENAEQDYVEQAFAVSGGATEATLSFHWRLTSQDMTLTPYDHFLVTLRNSSGDLVQTVFEGDNTDERGMWFSEEIAVDLAPYVGQTLRLRLEAQTDTSLPTTFFADDVSLFPGN